MRQGSLSYESGRRVQRQYHAKILEAAIVMATRERTGREDGLLLNNNPLLP